MIEVQNLHKYFGELEVLKGINARITDGECICVIGPSGGGKSTFLRCINLLEVPTKGDILIDGVSVMHNLRQLDKMRQKVGMVFQQFNLFPHMTVLKNITLAPVKLKKMTASEAGDKAMELLNRVGLADKANEYPNRLSGGQKQRVAIARVFLKAPPILILDEATSALDSVTEARIQGAFDRLARGRTTLIIAHRLSTIRSADRILVIQDGVVAEQGSHQELLAKNGVYATLYHTQNLGE